MIKKLKDLKEPLTISGDGRYDSMGHSAKFGAYTIFCCSLPLIIHFALVQVKTFALVELEGGGVYTHCIARYDHYRALYGFGFRNQETPPTPLASNQCVTDTLHLLFICYREMK